MSGGYREGHSWQREQHEQRQCKKVQGTGQGTVTVERGNWPDRYVIRALIWS